MADTVLTELKIHEFDSVEQMSQYESEIGDNDIVFTPDLSCRLPLLTPMWFDHVANDVSWLHADTFSWHGDDKYKAVYKHLLADFEGTIVETETIEDITIAFYRAEDGHKICLPDQESNIVALYEATGVAWYYILDTENKQFKLPRTKWGFTGLCDSVGGYIAPGLPNIAGKTKSAYGISNSTANSGALKTTTYTGGTASGMQDGGSGSDGEKIQSSTIEINASDSDPIYGASDTVQPPATQMYLYFYVGNFEQSATEQTAGLNAELFNNKADRDLGNTDFASLENIDGSLTWGGYEVIRQQAASKGANGYIKLNSGIIIQWGYKSVTAGQTASATITFPTAFSSTNYSCVATVQPSNASSLTIGIGVTGKTATTVSLASQGGWGGHNTSGYYWLAMGY